MKWKPASCDSYGNLHYFYQLLQNGNVQQEGSTTATHVILNEGIKACESYTFLVWSSYLNSNGTVVLEDVVAATYPNAPNITSLSTTASSITIRWSPPVDGSLCDVIEYNVIITSCLFTINKLTTNKYLHVEENINTGTEYNVKIAARNAKGYGEFSPNVMVATDVIKDGQINDLPAAAAAGNAETNIQKDEESNSNTSYIIAAILPSLFLLIIILLLLLVIRKLKKQNASQENSKHINNYLRMDAVNNPEEA
ncbi:uncharacterized protein [Antedon mediterranea]|uniref:uncharacterized protein n=1 Tax=Antedon mediterranea TaxID=105859 RepID=UPI003AF8FF8D